MISWPFALGPVAGQHITGGAYGQASCSPSARSQTEEKGTGVPLSPFRACPHNDLKLSLY
jgi:hypothetical protein